MKHKRWHLLFVLMLLGALLLSACGGGEAEPEPAVEEPVEEVEEPVEEAVEEPVEEPTEEPMEEPTEEPMEEVTEEPAEEAAEEEAGPTLTIWADNTRTPALESVAGDFEEEFGVNVVIEEVGFGDIRGLFTTAAPAGEGPDIIVGAHDWLGELVTNGLLAPLDLGDQAEEFDPLAIQAFTYDGELYGMPNATENVAFFYNTDLVPECPTTWEEVLEISRDLTADNTDNIDTNQYGFVRMQGDAYHFYPIQTAFGGYVFGQTEEGGYNPEDVGIDSEGSVAAAQWWNTMVEEGLQPPDVDWETMHLWFEEGKSAMTITGPWALPRIRDAGVNYAICDIPDQVEEGKPFLGSQGFMVSAFSEDPLLAQIFLTEFVATEEAMRAMYEADPRPPAYLPVREALEDEDIVAFSEAGADARPMPAIPEMADVWTSWESAIILVAQQSDEPESAFQNAAEQIRTAIEEGG